MTATGSTEDSGGVVVDSGNREEFNPPSSPPPSAEVTTLTEPEVKTVEAMETHLEKEAELESYLELINPKPAAEPPKRKSMKELLMSMPGYSEIAKLKPKIGGGKDDKRPDIILLDDETTNRKLSKREQAIESLKNRFVQHAWIDYKPKEKPEVEHVKLKIRRKEEDSQGVEHLVENEVDYVRKPMDEEAQNNLISPQSTSPQALVHGAKRCSLRESLLGLIKSKKMDAYKERVNHYKYDNEDFLDGDKEEEQEEEIVTDEEETGESEEEEEEYDEDEEEVQIRRKKKKKYKKVKSAFIESEAEDEDNDGVGADDEDDDDDSNSDSDASEEEDRDEIGLENDGGSSGANADIHQDQNTNSNLNSESKDSFESCPMDESEDLLSPTQSPKGKQKEPKSALEDEEEEMQSSKRTDCEVEKDSPTKATSSSVLHSRTPSDFWISSKSNVSSRHLDELSPLIPRIQRSSTATGFAERDSLNAHSSTSLSHIATTRTPTVTQTLANVITESTTKFDDLVDLCSGKFVTQQPSVPAAGGDDDDEFGNFDFGEDELSVEKENNGKDNVSEIKTPVAGGSISKTMASSNGITPKLSSRPTIARRSMNFDLEMEADAKDDEDDRRSVTDKTTLDFEESESSAPAPFKFGGDDDDESVVVTRKSIGKKKRLQFSDDEDDDEVDQSKAPPPPESEDEGSAEETQEDAIIEQPIIRNNPFFDKHGRMKRKFVEDEAELSGSEEGSADEDERGLNHYESDEADEEEIDEEAVKHQLERALRKHMLDDDDQIIRELQEKLLENGEFHQQRTKSFAEKLKLSNLNEDALMGASDEEADGEEDPEEASQKQAWLDKRKWMSENSHLLESEIDESQSLLTNFKLGKQTLKRIESFVETSTSESRDIVIKETSNKRKSFMEEILKAKRAQLKQQQQQQGKTNDETSAHITITSFSEGFNFGDTKNSKDSSGLEGGSESMTEPTYFGINDKPKPKKSTSSLSLLSGHGLAPKRGSFLSRGGEMFAKLAEQTKPGDAVSNVKNNSRNFVFSHITPPNPEKTDGSTSRVKRPLNKGSSCNAEAKKIKVDRSFQSMDETSKQSSVFQFL